MMRRIISGLAVIGLAGAPGVHAGGYASAAPQRTTQGASERTAQNAPQGTMENVPVRGPANVAPDSALSTELVVVVHGLGRTPASMLPLARTLERAGYRVLVWGYSSTCCSIAELGAQLDTELRSRRLADVQRVHFVGHSLGTVIIRWVLVHGELPAPTGRVVMLAPPNQGSHEADRFARWWGWFLKPLPELRTDAASTARRLAVPPGVEVGVIAGRYDGKVSLSETRLHSAAANTIVPATHSFLMHRYDVQRLTVDFLRHGCFAPRPAPAAAGVNCAAADEARDGAALRGHLR
jgi:pimeloyl-ACP methyl ester carboxylesterase